MIRSDFNAVGYLRSDDTMTHREKEQKISQAFFVLTQFFHHLYIYIYLVCVIPFYNNHFIYIYAYMWPDTYGDDDGFEYNSSQDSSVINRQIYLFEMRQSMKRDKHWKRRRNEPLCSISTRLLQAHAVLLKYSSKRYEDQSKIEQKSFGAQSYLSEVKRNFDCDEEYKDDDEPVEDRPRKRSKPIGNKYLIGFSQFRKQFYKNHRENIKQSLSQCKSGSSVCNVRLAPIHESAQIDFMRRLEDNRNLEPQLVYHGTRHINIESILRFGFLVPNETHPTNSQAPVIRSVNGQAYGRGIYCSRTAVYSLGYAYTTNSILVCAALPDLDSTGKINYFGNILVLPEVSQIIPLFLMDCKLKQKNEQLSHSFWYPSGQRLQFDSSPKEKKPIYIAKQILRVVLKHINNRMRKYQRYQIRQFS